MELLTIRQEALIQLLGMPDPPEMGERSNHLTVEGDSEAEEIKKYLASTYVAHIRLQHATQDLGQIC